MAADFTSPRPCIARHSRCWVAAIANRRVASSSDTRIDDSSTPATNNRRCAIGLGDVLRQLPQATLTDVEQQAGGTHFRDAAKHPLGGLEMRDRKRPAVADCEILGAKAWAGTAGSCRRVCCPFRRSNIRTHHGSPAFRQIRLGEQFGRHRFRIPRPSRASRTRPSRTSNAPSGMDGPATSKPDDPFRFDRHIFAFRTWRFLKAHAAGPRRRNERGCIRRASRNRYRAGVSGVELKVSSHSARLRSPRPARKANRCVACSSPISNLTASVPSDRICADAR